MPSGEPTVQLLRDDEALGAQRRGPAREPRRGRRWALALVVLVALGGLAAVLATSAGSSSRGGQTGATPPSSYAVGMRVLPLVDTSRTVELPGGPQPRSLPTYVRYPAMGTPSVHDVTDAPAARAGAPFPLVVFGHGFNETPAFYGRLLDAWARAGYVVAAPVFPLENANAPGGPSESDLTNQPGDMRFVISQLLAASAERSGPLAGLIDPARIAVAGQSDGGDTALSVGYVAAVRDPRVGAVIVLSGAEMPGVEAPAFGAGGPPLLATQGTADTINPPAATATFFAAAAAPKFLLELQGAEHLPPYSYEQPQLGIVERVSTAFLDTYLKHSADGPGRMRQAGEINGVATLQSDP